MSDSELLDNYCRNHNQSNLAELFNRYSHLIYLVCLKYLSDNDAASDAVMDIYESLVEMLKYKKVENFKSWIYTVSKNKCLMIIRQKNIFYKQKKLFDIEFMESDSFLNHEDVSIFSNELLRSKVNELKEEQRVCIEQFYFNKMSYKKIALEQSIPEKKVKSYIQNGKRNLKIALLSELKKSDI
ncbi:MAG: sigma-70 family RNA polymerase sigma factor [Melioribacteraceae bacterium]|nr:sigma-70 family RNA polymerase sigma factor [Melioribacteraceae bacterium]MCF8355233.1 sigma-70 family RNA polymerase sigma factor [Melioribacteraceae bacterium]MCF8395220.1 sigma-70 family RNA polymerase sigma factor [Melioribacteraceae bacterium]MCF8420694.1 sigma-70 family RNA polymerase sigma factor [Melioribacteraceae bacterium]